MDDISIKEAFNLKREYFDNGNTKSYDFRFHKLQILKDAIKRYELEIVDALYKDLHKSDFEAFTSEIGFVYDEINYIMKHLKSWMKPKKVATPVTTYPAKSYLYSEPLGVVLIVGPWNYPFHLLMAPLVGAIAAGNCAILKPSNQANNTAKVVEKIITEIFDEEYISVIQGPGSILGNMLIEKFRFDHIFFTGSERVGKEVLKMAAAHLTPVTLELGGKSPAIVDKNTNLDLAAKRLTTAKYYNAGQTCVAPDYLLVHEDVKEDFLKIMIKYIKDFFGDNPRESKDLGRIINEKRFDVLKGFLDEGHVIVGGESNREEKYIAPTIIDGIDLDSAIMQEEIFGPILPVMTYKDTDQIIKVVRKNRYPLALYLFTNDKELEDFIIERIEFGGGCINNGLLHLLNSKLPFGGVGNSGMGNYHGRYSFDRFSHKKSILKSHKNIDMPLRYPPYSEGQLNLVKKVMK
ncbi:aldehyde dehydrogenase [Tissierella sp.]|uniref:aldehyde dehydrogenase n=1 Tax=Tissierella sp. TaxID=41274 RepID=UPI00286144ED|nr:aldehyde dehydrogenase [Tissierella sp.]MDR7857041.1 aldehyde dehydrogenase [Tissierella sp.]